MNIFLNITLYNEYVYCFMQDISLIKSCLFQLHHLKSSSIMALSKGIRQSRVLCTFSNSLKASSVQFTHHHQASDSDRFRNNQKDDQNEYGHFKNLKDACKLAAAIGFTGFAINHAFPKADLSAEEHNIDQEIVDKENR